MKNQERLKCLVRELLSILDSTEDSDEGKVFHPTTISSCRTAHVIQLEKIMSELKKLTNEM